MKASLAGNRVGEDGFTLIETLVALALTGLVLSALANITSQWLPNWNRGMERIQRNESISLALQRICADLAAAEYVPADREQRQPLFDGSELSVTFVRTALGPNAGPGGLDVVRIGETTDRSDLVMVRSRSPFRLSEQIQFSDPVVLLRAPFRLSFAYAGQDRVWKSSWHEAMLPAMVALTVRDATTERVLSVSTVASIHADAPAFESDGAAQNPKDGSKDDPKPANAAAGQDRSQ
jgi:general secretion pathway protein J